jgi:hypothetical protein
MLCALYFKPHFMVQRSGMSQIYRCITAIQTALNALIQRRDAVVNHCFVRIATLKNTNVEVVKEANKRPIYYKK